MTFPSESPAAKTSTPPFSYTPPAPMPAPAPAESGAERRRSADDRSASPGRALLTPFEWDSTERTLNLSGREREIAEAVFDDRTESAIARDLGISPHTVHTHVERLYRKLAVASRTQLVLRMMASALGRDGEAGRLGGRRSR